MIPTDEQILRAAQRKHRRNCEAIAEQCMRLLRSNADDHPAADEWRHGIAQREQPWADVPDHLQAMMCAEIREIVEDAVGD